MKNKNVDLGDYVERLMLEKKFPENLDKELLDQMKKDLTERVEDRINTVIISNLSEKDLEEFNYILDSNQKDADVQEFLEKSIPNLAQLIATELIVFRQTYLS